MKKFLLLFALSAVYFIQPAIAQTELGTTSHWYNRANYNPASIARPGFVYLFSNYRNQWTGIDGAPTVYNLLASGYSERYESAFGFSIIQDNLGLTTTLNPVAQYARRLDLNRDLYLSLGLSAGLYTRGVNGAAYEAVVIEDPSIDYTNQRYTSPDASLGFEIEGEFFIAGAASSHLFSLWKSDSEYTIANHRYVYALYKNSKHEAYNFMAGMQVSNRRNLTIVEATSIIRFKRPTGLVKGPTELFDLGLTYRTSSQLTMICGINLGPNMRLGYTYDFNFGTELSKNPSHEILLEYRIPLSRYWNTGHLWYY